VFEDRCRLSGCSCFECDNNCVAHLDNAGSKREAGQRFDFMYEYRKG
jgi:hypothetical protein